MKARALILVLLVGCPPTGDDDGTSKDDVVVDTDTGLDTDTDDHTGVIDSDTDVPEGYWFKWDDPLELHPGSPANYDRASVAIHETGAIMVGYEQELSVRYAVFDSNLVSTSTPALLAETPSSHPHVVPTSFGWMMAYQLGLGQSIEIADFGDDGVLRRPARLVDEPGDGEVRWPDVVPTENNKGVLTWYTRNFSDDDARYNLQVFNTATQRSIADAWIDVGDDTTGGPPALSGLPEGQFVVVWAERFENTGVINASLFEESGAGAQSTEIEVAQGTEGYSRPQVDMHEDGGFAVVWRDHTDDAIGLGSWLRFYDAGGSPKVAAITLDSNGSGDKPVVIVDNDLTMVAWQESHDGHAKIYVRLFEYGSGTPLTEAIRVDQDDDEEHDRAALALHRNDDGSLWGVVGWEREDQGDILLRRFEVREP